MNIDSIKRFVLAGMIVIGTGLSVPAVAQGGGGYHSGGGNYYHGGGGYYRGGGYRGDLRRLVLLPVLSSVLLPNCGLLLPADSLLPGGSTGCSG
jgi:hypothetical protein